MFVLVLQGVPFLDNEYCRTRDVIIGRHEAMISALRCAAPRKKTPVCTTLTKVLRLAKLTIGFHTQNAINELFTLFIC
jgi:hypothetical protein